MPAPRRAVAAAREEVDRSGSPGSKLLPRLDDRDRVTETAAMRPLAAHAAADAQATLAEPPIVRISIGRIEVCVTQPPVPAPRQPAARPTVGMSLESYLQHREGRAR